MKKILILILLSIFSLMAKSQIYTCYYLDGYWGQWEEQIMFRLYGNSHSFSVYEYGTHPSEFIFRFQIHSYSTPDKKTIKHHFKNNLWYEYSGTVEYYVSEEYPTIRTILRKYRFPFYGGWVRPGPCATRTAKATIRIAPYKQYPRVYNIWFDDVAVGIDLRDLHFNH